MAESAPEVNLAAPPVVSQNPGTFEELHKRAQDVFPMCFEGARVMVQKGLSSHFQVAHTITLSSINTGYKFGATYVGTQKMGEGEAYPILLGDTDAAGNTTATIVHQFTPRWKAKLQGQVQKSTIAGAQASLERRGDLYTAGITLANTDIVNDSGVFVAHYLRRITSKLDIGVEFLNMYGPQVPGRTMSNVTYAARYSTPTWTAALSMSDKNTNASYYHKQTPNLSFGVEFTCNKMQGDALTTFAYCAEIPEEGVTFRASVDTNWQVGGVIEKRLSQFLPFTLAISGLLNHSRAAGKFGIGLIIG